MKRLFCLLLALCLLAGCAGAAAGSGTSQTAPSAPPPTAAPQALTVYDETGSAAVQQALRAYADACGVTLTFADSSDGADLLALWAPPESGCRDLLGDDLLAAAAARAGVTDGACTALSLGRTLYGYWADGAVLSALLGDGAAADLQKTTWEEWQAFVQAVTVWLAEPKAATVMLNGRQYSLPARRPPEAEALAAVFVPEGLFCGGAAYTGVLLAAGGDRTDETLTGPLNALAAALELERSNGLAADTPGSALQSGTVLFERLPLAELTAALAAGGDTPGSGGLCDRLTVVPFKCAFAEQDVTGEEYNLAGLMNYPVLMDAAWLAVPADSSDTSAKAAAAALAWLYGSGRAETVLTETLGLITPWGTASDTAPVLALQVAQAGAGILPAALPPAGQRAALREAEADPETFVTTAAAVLSGA